MSSTAHILFAKMSFLPLVHRRAKQRRCQLAIRAREADSPSVIHFRVKILNTVVSWFFVWQARKARHRSIVRQIRKLRRLQLCPSHSLKWEACFNGLKLGCSPRVMWTASTACEVTEKFVTFIVYSKFVTKLEYARRVMWAACTACGVTEKLVTCMLYTEFVALMFCTIWGDAWHEPCGPLFKLSFKLLIVNTVIPVEWVRVTDTA